MAEAHSSSVPGPLRRWEWGQWAWLGRPAKAWHTHTEGSQCHRRNRHNGFAERGGGRGQEYQCGPWIGKDSSARLSPEDWSSCEGETLSQDENPIPPRMYNLSNNSTEIATQTTLGQDTLIGRYLCFYSNISCYKWSGGHCCPLLIWAAGIKPVHFKRDAFSCIASLLSKRWAGPRYNYHTFVYPWCCYQETVYFLLSATPSVVEGQLKTWRWDLNKQPPIFS